MRTAKKTVPTLDLFRLAAVLLVVMNHTSPLADVSAMADFWLTRVLARVAVPFFLMTTGYFLSRNHWAGVGRQLKKLCLLYGVCILLYLPVNLYAGSFTGPADVLRKLLVDGTFYHLWYFPATILGIVIARWLSRLGLRVALPVAALLYLIGLGGDSYYGLVSQIPLLRTLYDGIFTLCGYTRNGLFFAPLFLLLGAAGRRWNQKLSLAGFFLSLAAMSAEGLWLHRMDVQRHDSMYLALPLCILAENRKEILEAFRLPNLVVDGVFSHLYVSDSLEAEDVAYTQEQLTLFYDTVAWLRTAGYDPGKVHIQSSYGLWNLPAQPCDYVRAGIALYGVRSDDAPVQRSLDLRPVLSLRARVASIRTVQAGESAGYGRVFQAEQETKLAVVTIGYADGLPRDLPQRGGQVLIQGRRCPMVGRMCMDQLLVDVSDLSEVAPDDTVTIIGRDGGQVIRAEELAACCGTITNELLSRLGMRLPIVSG